MIDQPQGRRSHYLARCRIGLEPRCSLRLRRGLGCTIAPRLCQPTQFRPSGRPEPAFPTPADRGAARLTSVLNGLDCVLVVKAANAQLGATGFDVGTEGQSACGGARSTSKRAVTTNANDNAIASLELNGEVANDNAMTLAA